MVSHEKSPEDDGAKGLSGDFEAEGYPRPENAEQALTYAREALQKALALYHPDSDTLSDEKDALKLAQFFAGSVMLSVDDAEHLTHGPIPMEGNDMRAQAGMLLDALEKREKKEAGESEE